MNHELLPSYLYLPPQSSWAHLFFQKPSILSWFHEVQISHDIFVQNREEKITSATVLNLWKASSAFAVMDLYRFHFHSGGKLDNKRQPNLLCEKKWSSWFSSTVGKLNTTNHSTDMRSHTYYTTKEKKLPSLNGKTSVATTFGPHRK